MDCVVDLAPGIHNFKPENQSGQWQGPARQKSNAARQIDFIIMLIGLVAMLLVFIFIAFHEIYKSKMETKVCGLN